MAMTETMRAITANVTDDNSRELRYEPDYPMAKPGRGEVLIKVVLAGICGTDHQILDDYKTIEDSLVLGHEFVGTIHSFGPDCAATNELKIDDRVVAEINCVPYGHMKARTAEEKAHDSSRTAIGIFGKDGAFADYICLPYENIHKVPDLVPTRIAVFTEPIAAACQILKQIHIKPNQKIGVLGSGKLGWIVCKVLASSSLNVHLITRRSIREIPEYLRKYDNNNEHIIPIISLSDNRNNENDFNDHFDFIVDCTGHSEGLQKAIAMVKPKGCIVLKSTCGSSSRCIVDLTPVVVKEIRIIGSRCGPFDVALRLLENEMLDVDTLITQVFSVEQGEKAFELARQPGVLKILLEF